MEKKIPKWEIEEFDEKDRKYDYSSYALDKAQENKIIKRNEHLTVNNLVAGELYSYKEICVLLNENPKTDTNKRKRQEENWAAFFEFKKVPRIGYKIFKIYKKPKLSKLINDSIKEIENEKNKYIYQVLLMLLYKPDSPSEKDYYEFRATKWKLFRLLGFANNLFFSTYSRHKDCAKDGEKVSASRIEQMWYKDVLGYFSQTLKRALESLHTCKKINYYWETKIVDSDTHKVRFANRTESIYITRIEGEILNEFDAESLYEIIDNDYALSNYKKKVIERCKEQLHIENYWDEIDIWVVKTNVRTGIMRMYQRFKGLGSNITAMQKQYQAEGAMMMNRLILNYFYELNNKISEKYFNYLRDRNKDLLDDPKFINETSAQAACIQYRRDELTKKYIEIKDYFESIKEYIFLPQNT